MTEKSRTEDVEKPAQETRSFSSDGGLVDAEFLDQFAHPVVIVSEDGEILQANDGVQEIDSKARELLVGENYREVIYPYTKGAGSKAESDTVLLSGATSQFEGHIKLRNNTVFPVTVTEQQLYHTDGTMVSIDVSNECGHGYSDDFTVPAKVTIGTDELVHSANVVFRELFSYPDSLEELSDDIVVKDAESFKNIVRRMFQRREGHSIIGKLEGEEEYLQFEFHVSTAGMTITGKQVKTGISQTLADSDSESELEKAERRYAPLLDKPYAFTALLDTTGRIIEVNQNAAGVVWESIEDIVGKRMVETSFADKQDTSVDIQDEIDRAAAGEMTEVDYNYDIGGEKLYFRVLSMPIYDGDEVVNVFTYGRDFTEYKTAKRERQKHKKEVETYQELTALSEKVHDVMTVQNTEEDVFEAVYNSLNDCTLYDSVWVAEYTPESESLRLAHSNVVSTPEEAVDGVSLDKIRGSEVAGVINTGEFQSLRRLSKPVIEEIGEEWGMEDYGNPTSDSNSGIVYPIKYEGRIYGLIACCGPKVGVNEDSREVSQLIGNRVGQQLHEIRRSKFSSSSEVTHLDVYTERVDDAFSEAFPTDGKVEITMIHSESTSFVKYGSSVGLSEQKVKDTFEYFGLGDAEYKFDTVCEERQELSIKMISEECRVTEISKNTRVEFHSLELSDRGLHLKLNIPKGEAPRDTLSKVQEVFPDAGIESRKTLNRGDQAHGDLSDGAMEDLTNRQRTVLEVALREGYWDSSIGANLSDIAEGLDISSSTVSEHLDKGLHRVFSRLF